MSNNDQLLSNKQKAYMFKNPIKTIKRVLNVIHNPQEMCIVVLGDPGVGKNKICYGFYNDGNVPQMPMPAFGTRRKVIKCLFSDFTCIIKRWDNEEDHLEQIITEHHFTAFEILFDRSNRESFENVAKYVETLRKHLKTPIFVIIGLTPPKKKKKNKKKKIRLVSKKEGQYLSTKLGGVKYIHIEKDWTKKICFPKHKMFFFMVKFLTCEKTRKHFEEKKEAELLEREKNYDQLEENLRKLHLCENYLGNFRKMKVIYDDLEYLTEEDLTQLIPDKIPRDRFKRFINKIKIENNTNPSSSSTSSEGSISPKSIEEEGEDTSSSTTSSSSSSQFEIDLENELKTTIKVVEYKTSPWENEVWWLHSNQITKNNEQQLSSGSYGLVYKGVLHIGLIRLNVAIKEQSFTSVQQRESIIHEVEIMSELYHRNLVKCFGMNIKNVNYLNINEDNNIKEEEEYTSPLSNNYSKNEYQKYKSQSVANNSNICVSQIVMELCNGDLFEIVHRKDYLTEFTLKERIKLIIQICEGVKYMHQRRISHRDLKPANILYKKKKNNNNNLSSSTENSNKYSNDYILKISDYGTSKHMESINHTLVGTPEYVPPESIDSEEIVENPMLSDIYSLGIMIWEIITGQLPYKKIFAKLLVQNNNSIPIGPYKKLVMIHRNEWRPDICEMEGSKVLHKLVQRCWDVDWRKRPNIEMVLESLKLLV